MSIIKEEMNNYFKYVYYLHMKKNALSFKERWRMKKEYKQMKKEMRESTLSFEDLNHIYECLYFMEVILFDTFGSVGSRIKVQYTKDNARIIIMSKSTHSVIITLTDKYENIEINIKRLYENKFQSRKEFNKHTIDNELEIHDEILIDKLIYEIQEEFIRVLDLYVKRDLIDLHDYTGIDL